MVNGGGLEALFVDTAGRIINPSYGNRVADHEAGHFLIAYLIGLLPRTYTLSSLDAFKRLEILHFVFVANLLILSSMSRGSAGLVLTDWSCFHCVCRYGALNVQAGTLFCDGAFQREVRIGSDLGYILYKSLMSFCALNCGTPAMPQCHLLNCSYSMTVIFTM